MSMEFNRGLEKIERLELQGKELSNIQPLSKPETTDALKFESSFVEIKESEKSELKNLNKLESKGLFEQYECLFDAEMTENIAEYLSGMENLKYENWKNLNLEQRAALLNTIETKISAIEHRPPVPIEVKKLKPNLFGYQDSANNLIALNSRVVMSDSKEAYTNVIDTIIHEGRHAYQHYNVDKKCIHESLSVVKTWQENFYNPKYKYYSGSSLIVIGPEKVGNVGYRLYYYQPVEIDARNFTSDVMLKLKQKGFFNN